MTPNETIALILDELTKAEKKFPLWPDDKIHAAGIVTEEVGELMQACIDYTYFSEHNLPMFEAKINQMKLEAAQVGAMAIRFLMGME